MINWERVALDLEREIVRLTKENEELRQRLAVEEAHSDKYRCENEELRKKVEFCEDRMVRLDSTIAVLKAKQESTEQWSHTMRQKKEWADEKDAEPVAWLPSTKWTACVKLPVVVHVRSQREGEKHVSTREGITPVKPDDLIMRGVNGEEYPIGRGIFEQTYRIGELPTPPTTTALLERLGDWVYTKMQQADSDYNNYGDTAEVYATLKMVLSKIESMIESLPLIEGE